MPASVAALLLAAGASRRMGTCKQLLPLRGKTLLATCLETLLKAGIPEVIVVVAPGADAVAEAAENYPVTVVRNDDPDGDMAASIRTGFGALTGQATGVLIALCDIPLVLPSSIACLAREHLQRPADILIPCHQGRRGHPPLVPHDLLAQLRPPLNLRDLLREHRHLERHLEFDDPGLLLDLDTPEDYRRIA